jgi:hypothetical protein
MAWQCGMTTATRGRQALAAAEQVRAAVPMTRRVVRGRRRAVGRTIVAYRRGDGAATNYEIAWVTVALQHLRAKDDSRARIDPVQRRLYTYGSAGALGHVAAPASLLALAAWQSGNGECKLGRPGCGRWRGSRARQQPRRP